MIVLIAGLVVYLYALTAVFWWASRIQGFWFQPYWALPAATLLVWFLGGSLVWNDASLSNFVFEIGLLFVLIPLIQALDVLYLRKRYVHGRGTRSWLLFAACALSAAALRFVMPVMAE